MKKTSNNPGIFKRIINFFDRYLITPITRCIMKIQDSLKMNTGGLERFLSKKQSLLVISLIAAFVMFYVTDHKIITLVDNSAEVLYGQPVDAIYNEELYVVEGIPETADITLIGRKSDVALAKQYPKHKIVIDLQEFKEGTHQVKAKYENEKYLSTVQYKVDPSTLNVVIYKKMSSNKELTYDIVNKDSLNSKLNIESVSLSRDSVIIKGAEYKLKTVASVKALIDINNLKNQEVGSQTIDNVPLVAYDKDGKVVKVEIVPEKIEATIKISSPSKNVPIKVETKGELDNKAIKSILTSASNVTLFGSQDVLENIEYVVAEIDVDGVKKDKKYTVNLKRPSGIRAMSLDEITITMTVDDIVTKEITGIKINPINLASGLKVQALSKEDSSITVVLKGSSSVIKNIDSSSINAYIDLSDLSVGEHEVNINVKGTDNRVTYQSKIKAIKVKISKE